MRELEKIKIALVGHGRVTLIPLDKRAPLVLVESEGKKTELADIKVENLLSRTPEILEKVKDLLNEEGQIIIFTEDNEYVTEISTRVDVIAPKDIQYKIMSTGRPEIWKDKRGCSFLSKRVFSSREKPTVHTINLSKPSNVKLAYSQKIRKVGRSKKSFRTALQEAFEADEEILE